MKLLKSDVKFEVLEVKFNGFTEQFIMTLKPLNVPLYPGPFVIRFHHRHDYSDFKYFRIFKTNNNLSSSDLNTLRGRIFQGHLAEFTKNDGSKFVGVHSTSLILQNNLANLSTNNIPPKAIKQSVNINTIMNAIDKTVKVSKTKSQTMRQMVIEALTQNGNPMNAKEIADAILKNGYHSKGKTLNTTIASIINMDIKNHGIGSMFVRTAPGIFNVRTQVVVPTVNVVSTVSEINEETLLDFVKSFLKNIKKTIKTVSGQSNE